MSDYVKITLTGRDGSTWCLSGAGAGREGVTLSPNVQNLIDAPVKTLWTPGPFGEQYAGKRVRRREVIFSVQVGHEGFDPDTWATVDSRWRWAWDYDEECTLTVETSDGIRNLKLRLLEEPKAYGSKDPFLTGDCEVMMTTVAEFPYWVSEPDVFIWKTPNLADRTTVFVANNGDVPVWLRWTFTAPGTWTIPDFSWDNDMFARGEMDRGRTLVLPELKQGEHITVDSDPRVQTIVSANDSPVQHRWKGNDLLYPLMPGKSGEIPVGFKVNSTAPGSENGGAFKLTIPKWYSRPWSRPHVIRTVH
ncbi:minor tail protein [Mycobacterium phage Bazzle]